MSITNNPSCLEVRHVHVIDDTKTKCRICGKPYTDMPIETWWTK